jgi:hypothetical protein
VSRGGGPGGLSCGGRRGLLRSCWDPLWLAFTASRILCSVIRRALLIVGGVGAAVLLAIGIGVIPLPGTQDNAAATQTAATQTSAQAALAAKRMAANRQWAAATCTSIMSWKNELHRDATSFDLGFGPVARIHDAIAATTRLSNEVSTLGLPPTAQTARTRAEIEQLRSDIESRVRNVEAAAGSVANGNPVAIGSLLSDLEAGTAVGPQIVTELRHVLSVDLGISLVETRACRQLVGIPV